MNLNRGRIRKRRRTHFAAAVQPSKDQKPAAFDAEDDSDPEKPRLRAVSEFVPPAPTVPTNNLKKLPQGSLGSSESRTNGPKQGERVSQIAKLVERRKTAESIMQDGISSLPAKDEAMFRYDIDKCPDQASLAAYKQTPVDGFGAAMLKAMGWRGPGESNDKSGGFQKTFERKPRPNRLGLGAKLELAVAGDDTKLKPRSNSQAEGLNGSADRSGQGESDSGSQDDNSENVFRIQGSKPPK